MFFALTAGLLLTLGAFFTFREVTNPVRKPISLLYADDRGLVPDYLKSIIGNITPLIAQLNWTRMTPTVFSDQMKARLEKAAGKQIASLLGNKAARNKVNEIILRELMLKQGLGPMDPRLIGSVSNIQGADVSGLAGNMDTLGSNMDGLDILAGAGGGLGPKDLKNLNKDLLPDDLAGKIPGDLPDDLPGKLPGDLPDKVPDDLAGKLPADYKNYDKGQLDKHGSAFGAKDKINLSQNDYGNIFGRKKRWFRQ